MARRQERLQAPRDRLRRYSVPDDVRGFGCGRLIRLPRPPPSLRSPFDDAFDGVDELAQLFPHEAAASGIRIQRRRRSRSSSQCSSTRSRASVDSTRQGPWSLSGDSGRAASAGPRPSRPASSSASRIAASRGSSPSSTEPFGTIHPCRWLSSPAPPRRAPYGSDRESPPPVGAHAPSIPPARAVFEAPRPNQR